MTLLLAIGCLAGVIVPMGVVIVIGIIDIFAETPPPATRPADETGERA